MNKKEQAIKLVKSLNNKIEASTINVPVLENFNILKNITEENTIFAAISDKKYIEQLVLDSTITENDTLESKVEESIKKSQEYMSKTNLEYPNQNFIHLKDYMGIFKFKIYVQDYIFSTKEKRAIRQLNAYFIDPQFNKFYQLSLSTGPISLPSKEFEPGVVNLKTDLITKELVAMMDTILSNIRYN